MQNSAADLQTNHDVGQLPFVIEGIKFTNREVDIIACIVNVRGSSKMASLLSISPRTCETHILNIMRKISCNSREGIVDFVEKTSYSFVLNKHYQSLLAQFDFGKKLNSLVAYGKSITCHIVHVSSKNKNDVNFADDLTIHLKLCGIQVIVHDGYEKSVAPESNEHVIYLISKVEEQHFKKKQKDFFESQKSKFLKNENLFTLLLIDQISEQLPCEFNKCILRKTMLNFQELFSAVLKRIFWDKNFDKTLLEFQKKSILESDHQQWPQNLLATQKETLGFDWKNILRTKKYPIGFAAIFGVVITFTIIDKLPKSKKAPIVQGAKADLLVPVESVLLNRSDLLLQIDNKLQGKEGIQAVALVSIGGAGKTTLARLYAKQKKAYLVWEINAETKEGLVSSFELLAQTLCKTQEDQVALEENQKIKNPAIRDERILLFVKDKLKALNNWLLIYDNVEKFANIQKWFPCDPTSWGNGRVIVTTRDSNLQNNVHINGAIQVGELTPAEKLHLFMKIMKDVSPSKASEEQKNAADKFLAHIPPFPLDVSVTAYYLKTTNLSYDKYLDCLKGRNKDFTSTQEAILKEVSDYTKTRHEIITLSLKKLIETHKDFADLLLLISLLDSQNIPRDLLESFKSTAVIDNFIHHLKKHSLIANQPDIFSSVSTLSIHRSTQESILDYFLSDLNLENNPQLMLRIANTIAQYAAEAMEKDDIPRVRLLANHCEKFLSHDSLLTGASSGVVQGKLGVIYSYLSNCLKAQEFLSKSYDNLNKYYPNNYEGIAEVLVRLGEAHTDIGDHEKPESFLEQSLLIYKKYCPDKPSKIASTLVSLGRVYRLIGCYEKARDRLEEALSIYREHFSEDYPSVVWALAQLGDTYRNLNDYQKAENLFEEAMIICKQKIPKNYFKFCAVSLHLGKLYRDIGRYEKAIELFEKSLEICEKYLPTDSSTLASHVGNLGILYREMGQYEKAKEFLERALLIYKNCLLENNQSNAWLLGHLGNIHGKMGDLDKSKECFEKALFICQKCLPVHNPNLGWLLGHLGNTYRKLGDHQKAIDLLERSLVAYEKCLPKDHVYVGTSFIRLANVYWDLGVYEKTQHFLEETLSIFEKRYGQYHLRTGHALKCLGRVHLMQGNLEKAENYLGKAWAIFQSYKYVERYSVLEDQADLFLKKSESTDKKNEKEEFNERAVSLLKQALEILNTLTVKNSTDHLRRIKSKLSRIPYEHKIG
ncbi:tetratricopeptide repeat protein [Candidatus Finniella inopinata]|uniref:Tetratricopeptide repeat protein n=1 Tax=Candidatus Finniella inopinata TaxID=1696036 RepID=A0A4Q7DHM6_9PROT|nr:tetratricopeptide repeat protein [Candidatus Finniella inopinata]RZI46212.1 tetratricopeptide repeat protein [Candidatus Finniella inopinata]